MSEGRKVEVLAAQGDAELAQIIYGRKDAGHVAPLQRRSRTKLRSAVRQRRAGALNHLGSTRGPRQAATSPTRISARTLSPARARLSGSMPGMDRMLRSSHKPIPLRVVRRLEITHRRAAL